MPPRILVVGLGNLLCRDDGVGVHACRELSARVEAWSSVCCVEVGTAFGYALELFAGADKLLVLDAMHGGGAPGTIYGAELSDLAPRPPALGLHELGLVETLRLLGLTSPPGRSQPEVAILGVEPSSLALGLDLSPEVRAAVPVLLDRAGALLMRWLEA